MEKRFWRRGVVVLDEARRMEQRQQRLADDVEEQLAWLVEALERYADALASAPVGSPKAAAREASRRLLGMLGTPEATEVEAIYKEIQQGADALRVYFTDLAPPGPVVARPRRRTISRFTYAMLIWRYM